MKNRDFRELQVSSTQLAVIFLGILVIGVIIFLLGVSVGKKHAQIAQKSNAAAQKEPGQVKDKIILPESKPASIQPASGQKEPLLAEKPKQEPRVEPKIEAAKPEPKKVELAKQEAKAAEKIQMTKTNLYYVQVGALADKPTALAMAQKFKAQGYAAVVMDPFPTDKKPVYRVRIGGFETKEEAEAARMKLATASGRKKADYFIVRD
jgi:cell division septation protein DedD